MNHLFKKIITPIDKYFNPNSRAGLFVKMDLNSRAELREIFAIINLGFRFCKKISEQVYVLCNGDCDGDQPYNNKFFIFVSGYAFAWYYKPSPVEIKLNTNDRIFKIWQNFKGIYETSKKFKKKYKKLKKTKINNR